MEINQDKVVIDKKEICDYQWLEFKEALERINHESARYILRKTISFLFPDKGDLKAKRKRFRCPIDNAFLKKKEMIHGMPAVLDRDKYIICGCCFIIGPNLKYGYQCPECKEIFFSVNDKERIYNDVEFPEAMNNPNMKVDDMIILD